MTKEKRRHFGGNLNVFVDYKENPINGRAYRNFERRHLRAYLRGDNKFYYDGKWLNVFEQWK